MDYSELLIGHTQLMIVLAGFSALLLALPVSDMEEVHSGWGARALIIQAIFAALLSLFGLTVLSSELQPSEKWRLCSSIYVVAAVPAVMLNIWDSQRIQKLGVRAKSTAVYVLCWALGAFSIGANIINMIIQEPSFAYYFWGLAGNGITGFILFTQNVFLFTHDPSQDQQIDQTLEAHELR